MKQRIFGKTGRAVSEIGLGTWQLGTRWGDPFNKEEAFKILETAEAAGITFIDTADVYNGGKSEETIGEYIAAHPGKFYVTTKSCFLIRLSRRETVRGRLPAGILSAFSIPHPPPRTPFRHPEWRGRRARGGRSGGCARLWRLFPCRCRCGPRRS